MPAPTRNLPVPLDYDLKACLIIAAGMVASRRGRFVQVDECSGGFALLPAYLDRPGASVEGKSVLGLDGRTRNVEPPAA